MLRLTHLSRRREHTLWMMDDDGLYIRFTGDGNEWDEMRQELKDWGYPHTRWMPKYMWDDGKQGAWWVNEALFEVRYLALDRFHNLSHSMYEATDNETQWIYKWRRGWEGSRPPRYQQQYQSTPKWESARPVPAHLKEEYSLLGVGATATLDEVHTAYRRLSKVYHPDAGGTHEGFIVLQRAYEQVSKWVELMEVRA